MTPSLSVELSFVPLRFHNPYNIVLRHTIIAILEMRVLAVIGCEPLAMQLS